jgi:hypothetical protein
MAELLRKVKQREIEKEGLMTDEEFKEIVKQTLE